MSCICEHPSEEPKATYYKAFNHSANYNINKYKEVLYAYNVHYIYL